MPVSDENFSLCCRLCLESKTNTLNKLFSNVYDDSVADTIFTVLGIQITKFDNLTINLCSQCYSLVSNWDAYRKKCVNNQTKLIKWLERSQRSLLNQSIQVKDEPIDEDVIVLEAEDENGLLDTTPDLPPALSPNLPNQVEIPNHIDEPSNGFDTQPDKIDFAAGLQLQRRGVSTMGPTTALTESEKFYITKYKLIFSVYKSNTCLCHNQKFPINKYLMNHVRKGPDGGHFAKYTCYSCLITFDGRASSGRHRTVCPHSKFNAVQQIMNTVQRPATKYRLFQNFHCVPCQFIFTFYEDYCAHVQSEHVEGDGPYDCRCGKQFEHLDSFKQHILKSCFLSYYCDICLDLHPSLDDFKKHNHEMHEGDFVPFLNVHSSFKIFSSNPSHLDAPDIFGEEIDVKDDHIRMFKDVPGKCPICETVISNFYNLCKHIGKVHKINAVLAKNLAAKSYQETPPPELTNSVPEKKPKRTPSAVVTTPIAPKKPMLSSSKRFICEICDNSFSNLQNLQRHQRNVHRLMSDTHNCHDCYDSFGDLESLERHRSESHTFACLDCGAKCSDKEDLERHRKSHLKLSITRDPNTKNYRSSASKTKGDENGDEEVEEDDDMPLLTLAEPDRKSVLQRGMCCNLCLINFETKLDVKAHYDKVHNLGVMEFPKKCDVCGRLILRLNGWINHMKSHTNPSVKYPAKHPVKHPVFRKGKKGDEEGDYFTCKKCFKVFRWKKMYKDHMKCHGIKSPSKPTTTANDSPITQSSLAQNKIKMKVYCKHCKIPFNDDKGLMKHMQDEHDEQSKKKIPCRHCRMMLPNEKAYEKHMATMHYDTDKLRCPVCKKVCLSGTGLASHVRTHRRKQEMAAAAAVDDRNDSPSAFMAQRAMEPQVIIKTEVNSSLVCTICCRTYGRKDALRTHMLKKHPESPMVNEGPLKCPHCDRRFMKPNAFAIHMKVHKKEESNRAAAKASPQPSTQPSAPTPGPHKFKFSCGICHEGFDVPKELKEHIMRRHPF